MHTDFPRRKRRVALRANHNGIEHLPAALMFMKHGAAALIQHMHIAPMDDGHHDGIQVQALLGEDVLVPFRRVLIWNPTENPEANEFF